METSLDLTAFIIHVADRQFGPRIIPEDFLNYLLPAYSVSQEQRKVPVSERVTPASSQDAITLPPVYISDVTAYQDFLERKAGISRYDRKVFEIARETANPYEKLGRSIFMNRAGLKLANIDAIFKVTRHIGAFMSLTTPGIFKFCDLAGAPGAFTQYIQWRRPEAIGYGITLKNSVNAGGVAIPEWNLRQLDANRFLPFYGANETGNLYTEWQSFVNRVRQDQAMGVDLVTADGGFDVETERAFARQEFLSFRLIMVQLLTALKLLQPGGDFVMKMFDTVTELSAQLLYIAALCFERISLFKPIASRPANAEKYLICQGKLKGTEMYELLLSQANETYNEDEVIVNLLDSPLPQDFTEWLIQLNDSFMANQQEAIEWIFQILEGGNPIIPIVDLHRALILFNVPGDPITKYSRVKVPGTGKAARPTLTSS